MVRQTLVRSSSAEKHYGNTRQAAGNTFVCGSELEGGRGPLSLRGPPPIEYLLDFFFISRVFLFDCTVACRANNTEINYDHMQFLMCVFLCVRRFVCALCRLLTACESDGGVVTKNSGLLHLFV